MTNQSAKFGELTLQPLDDNDAFNDDQNVFSNIDLNGGQTPKASDSAEISEILNDYDNNNNKTSLKNNSSYTSFGEALSNKINSNMNQQTNQQNSPKKIVPSESITSTDFVNINSRDYPNEPSISPTSMLSSASDVSAKFATKTASTIESFRLWGKSAYKCTRQIVSEKLGKSSRTIDPELDVTIDNLRETKKKYEQVLSFSRNLGIHFSNIMQSQKYMSDTFADLAQKSPELIGEFTSNAETQRTLIKNGDHLLNAISHFTNTLTTLCHKTMEDTFQTIRNYEAARVEYDAYRFDLESIKAMPEDRSNEIAGLERELAIYKERYENLKKDVLIKVKFLDENRIKVMRKQLNQFQLAISIYFSGNNEALQKSLKQLRESKLQEQTISSPSTESFLEQ